MNSINGCRWVAGIVLSLLCVVTVAFAADQATPKRTPQQIMGDLMAASRELQQVAPSLQVLLDESKRAEIAPQAIPALKKMLVLFDEIIDVQPMAKAQMTTARMQFLSMLSLMGDADAAAALEKGAQSADAAEALSSKSAQLLVRWWKAMKDPAEQGKVLDAIAALAGDNAASQELAVIAITMSEQGAANADLKARTRKIITDKLTSDAAKQFTQHVRSVEKLESLAGKPLVIEGVKLDGTKFSTADWKGKVILVDFWATWCGPCLQELPRVKKIYADYHDKGLEIIGVSCDRTDQDLSKFLAENKDMPWPQLFDKARPGWHALAKEYGVSGIPTMFLIDKKGVVRTVEARASFEELIPKMLEEK